MFTRFTVLVAFTLVAFGGCRDPKGKKASQEPAPIKKVDHKGAGYQVSTDDTWKIEDAKALNTHADFAISKDEQLFFLVIPQPLPVLPNVETPNALDLKRASVSVMEQQIDAFEIELQGPVNIDEQLGHTVVAHGQVEGDHIKYVTSYFAVGDRGFQIVAWGPFDRGPELIKETDNILATITFERPSKPSVEADAGSAEDDKLEKPNSPEEALKEAPKEATEKKATE